MGKVIAIVGTRFTHLHSAKWEKRIFEFIDSLNPDTEIISNGAPGTDITAIGYARAQGIKVRVLFPNTDYTHDPHFFLHTNETVVGMADELHAFWDGQSPGTHHAIIYAREIGKPVHIHNVLDEEWEAQV